MKNKSSFENLIERMWPPGWEKVARHVPSINKLSGKLGWMLLMNIGPLLSAFIVYQLDKINPWRCYYTQAAMIIGAFLLVDILGHWCRPQLQEIFGDRAYNVAFCYLFLPGLYLGFTPSYIHIVTAPGVRILPALPFAIISIPFLIIGLLLFIQVTLRLGMDRQYYMYQYYPDEGTMSQDAIYNYIRHPLYAALIYLLVGLMLASGTFQGFIMALIILLYFPGRIFPEEADLVKRFGKEYLDYRKRVPAFLPRIVAWSGFLKCLIDVKRKNT